MSCYEFEDILEKISNAIVGVFDVSELQEKVLDLCEDIFEAEACSLFLFDENHEYLKIVAARGYTAKFMDYPPLFKAREDWVENPTTPEEKLGITGWIATTGKSFRSNSTEEHQSHPHWRGEYDTEQFGPGRYIQNFYGVPLKVGDEGIIGVLKVEGIRENGKFVKFTEADAQLCDILASHIAIAIADARRVEEMKRQSAQRKTITDALHKVIGSLSEELPMQYLLNEIVATTAKVLSAEACVLFLKDEKRNNLIEQAGVGYVEQLIGIAEYGLIPQDKLIEKPERDEDKVGLTTWIAITGRPFLARNNDELRAHPHWRGRYDPKHYPEGSGKKCESFIGLPLRVGDEILGVLKVENKKIDGEYMPFTDQDEQVFGTLARSLAIAIGTVQKERVKREQAITDAMYSVSQGLAGRFELDPLLEEIVKVGKKIFNADACVVFLVDQIDPARLFETKGEGYAKHLEGIAEYRLIPKEKLAERPERKEDKVGLTAWIAITGKPFLARSNDELKAHPHWLGRYDEEHYPKGSGKKCESFLGLPLKVGDEILGILKVENKKDTTGEYVPFDEREQHIFQLLANSAAIAIRNARDFQKLQEAQKLAAIGRSAAAMAHQIRSPLQDIRTTAELLSEELKNTGRASEQSYGDLEDIIKRVEQMDNAIERVRKAAKQLKPTLKFYNIKDILHNSFTHNRSLSQIFQRRKIHTKIVGLEQLKNRSVRCDRDLLEEAISNLVDNALEAVSDGGYITISVTESDEELKIEMEDSGPGVDENLRLFEPFNTTKEGGLGLGLFIVHRNIEVHKGTITYVKRENKGACFRIELPHHGKREK